MRRFLFGKRGQATFDYAVLICAVAVALILISVWGKRALVGRGVATSEEIGDQYSIEHGQEYVVGYSYSNTGEEAADELTITDINRQYSGRARKVSTPDVGDETDATEIPHDDPWETGWSRGFGWQGGPSGNIE